MARFTVGIYKRHISAYKACFEDLAEALAATLRRLGHETVGFGAPGRIIMFGAIDSGSSVPADTITFNTEQLTVDVNRQEFAKAAKKNPDRVIWDYSTKNIEILRELGFRRAVHCPVGYAPEMTRIAPAAEEDIDVLFYGACSGRRKTVMEALEGDGFKIMIGSGIFGRDLDPYIARAKVVLNVHFYEQPIFEVVRCSHLWANKKCVVTEDGGLDQELEELARVCSFRVPYDKLVATCGTMVKSAERRRAGAELGFEMFKKVDFARSVHKALEES